MSRETIIGNLQLSITLLTIFLMTLSLSEGNEIQVKEEKQSVNPDVKLSTPELIKKYGYPVQNHTVKTEDGYILTLHRIPRGKKPKARPKKRIPVIVQHCLLGSSADWVIAGPGKGLAYILADAGYDVWLGNNRGNVYSRSHVSLSPKDNKFWDFSWHEMGLYDLPAMIDYVLKKARVRKLFYIGHSQGTTQFFVMASEKPEYNKKIRVMFGLAPVAYMFFAKTPLKFIAPLFFNKQLLLQMLGPYEFRPHPRMMILIGQLFCNLHTKNREMCSNVLFLIAGYGSHRLNATLLPVILGHTPAGASTKQLIHLIQGFTSVGKFRQYDYGRNGNKEHYGDVTPPNYNLKNVTAPVSLHYSDNDWLASIHAVDKLYRELPNKVGNFRIPMDTYNHLDFIWATDAPEVVYKDVISLMDKHSKVED